MLILLFFLKSSLGFYCLNEENYLTGLSKRKQDLYQNWKNTLLGPPIVSPSFHYFVYKENPVVVKCLLGDTAENKKNAKNEAFLLHKFRHLRGVVDSPLCIESENTIIFFTERLYGDLERSRFTLLKKSWEERLQMVLEVTETFVLIHANNLVHSDIKPANLMFNERTNIIKVIDLGYTVTQGDPIRGFTALFAAPELISSHKPITAHWNQDVWSWSLTMLFILFPMIQDEVVRILNPTIFTPFDVRLLPLIFKRLEEQDKHIGLSLNLFFMNWLTENPEFRMEMDDIASDLRFIIASVIRVPVMKRSRSAHALRPTAVQVNKPVTRKFTGANLIIKKNDWLPQSSSGGDIKLKTPKRLGTKGSKLSPRDSKLSPRTPKRNSLFIEE